MQEADHAALRPKAEQQEREQRKPQHEAIPDEGRGRPPLQVAHQKEDAQETRYCRGEKAYQKPTHLVSRNALGRLDRVIEFLQPGPQHDGR